MSLGSFPIHARCPVQGHETGSVRAQKEPQEAVLPYTPRSSDQPSDGAGVFAVTGRMHTCMQVYAALLRLRWAVEYKQERQQNSERMGTRGGTQIGEQSIISSILEFLS